MEKSRSEKFRNSVVTRVVSLATALAVAVSPLPAFSMTAQAAEGGAIRQTYGDYTFTKVSNPDSGSRQPDGINTDDLTGYPANRLNSYAWAVASRGSNIYIGTNRTLFGSAINAVAENLAKQGIDVSDETLGALFKILSGGDVPVNLDVEEYIPQIIKFDTETGKTEVIYQPRTVTGEDGELYYADKEGNIIPNADVASETASFRSVIEFNGNLYFGSLGTNMLQLVRVDEEDNAKVVFQTLGLASSLRACSVYDDGERETIYFGGQDTTNMTWRAYRANNPDKPSPLPIVIRYLDPETAGTEQEDWSGLVADFRDFGKYAYARVYVSGGGNVWDLCSYNGKLYLVMAYDGGWALFRGEKGGDAPNQYGWTWTEIVGDDGQYPLAMDEELAPLNEQFRQDYSCNEYSTTLNGVGLLESTATPYVFNGKMYIGSFDNATVIQSQTATKIFVKLRYLMNALETGEIDDLGPTLTQIYAPIYEVLSRPQHIYVMDENETITPVEQANDLLAGTTNDYVWRFIEYDGKLYTGTFDSSSAYIYFLDYSMDRIVSLLRDNQADLPGFFQELFAGTFSAKIADLMGAAKEETQGTDAVVEEYEAAAIDASASMERFLNGEGEAEQLYEDMSALEAAQAKVEEEMSFSALKAVRARCAMIPEKVKEMVSWLLQTVDTEGLKYWFKAKALAKNAESGFDLFVTEDGENWEKIVGDGLMDSYNYGARTFTICNDELYLGTANPYYGAQLWKVNYEKPMEPAAVICEPTARKFLSYNGWSQKLLNPGKALGGTIVYGVAEMPEKGWMTSVPCVVDAGTYTVCWKVVGDENHLDVPGGKITVKIDKNVAKTMVKPMPLMLKYNGKPQMLAAPGMCFGGSIQYSVNGIVYSKFIPTAVKPGIYKIFWRVVGDDNHVGTQRGMFVSTIGKGFTPPHFGLFTKF